MLENVVDVSHGMKAIVRQYGKRTEWGVRKERIHLQSVFFSILFTLPRDKRTEKGPQEKFVLPLLLSLFLLAEKEEEKKESVLTSVRLRRD